MGKPCSCTQFIENCIFFLLQICENQYYKSHENSYEVLQVVCASEPAMKLMVRMINHFHQSTKLYRKKYHSFVAVGIVTHAAHS